MSILFMFTASSVVLGLIVSYFILHSLFKEKNTPTKENSLDSNLVVYKQTFNIYPNGTNSARSGLDK